MSERQRNGELPDGPFVALLSRVDQRRPDFKMLLGLEEFQRVLSPEQELFLSVIASGTDLRSTVEELEREYIIPEKTHFLRELLAVLAEFPSQSKRGRVVIPIARIATKPEEWESNALCREIDPELFFPEKGGSTAEAKRVCELCDVTEECLKKALEVHEPFGVWGGKSERERRKILRTRGVEIPKDDESDESSEETQEEGAA